MRCAIWYHLCKLKNMKSTHGGVLILVKMQAESWNFTKINTPPWAFSVFLKLYKWYQIAQRITYGYFIKVHRWISVNFTLHKELFFLSTMITDLPTVTDKHESFYNIYQYSIFHINFSNLAISSPLSLTKFKNPLDNSVSANAELMITNASQKHP